ncbi:hypothetical protein NUW58_g10634 [Xylaria curta]|uniref:Uncharacterized protein n=1 Tax=Xylaria curta TaxID=42375 RepID=A0ACC1MI20_9PEZI|nr:hypothetical protein NUW58_g10634 [Xylaria curta]
MKCALFNVLSLGLSASQASASPHVDSQIVLSSPNSVDNDNDVPFHAVDDAIIAALDAHPDPVDALVALRPELAHDLAEPRLLHVFGRDAPQWLPRGTSCAFAGRAASFGTLLAMRTTWTPRLQATLICPIYPTSRS